jgi:hypothetical protein
MTDGKRKGLLRFDAPNIAQQAHLVNGKDGRLRGRGTGRKQKKMDKTSLRGE